MGCCRGERRERARSPCPRCAPLIAELEAEVAALRERLQFRPCGYTGPGAAVCEVRGRTAASPGAAVCRAHGAAVRLARRSA